jgi:mannitol/fructose-specific phosphotransferase system IIA component (Ntr-type)
VTAPSLAVAKVPGGVDFGAPDGPATLVFLIAAPAAGDGQHLKILAALARKLVNAEFKDSLRAAEDGATVAHIVNEAVAP